MPKRAFWTLVVTMAFIPAAARAVDTRQINWTTQVSFLSDYYTRGISQTQELPAPQILSTIYHKETGLYAGIFASRVEFADGDAADAEIDPYIGINRYQGKFNYRIGLIYYLYPDADSSFNYDFAELDLGVGYDFGFFSSSLGIRYSPNYFANSGKETYVTFDMEIPVIEKLKSIAHLGRRDIEKNERFYGFPDNYDWSLGLEYSFTSDLKIMGKYADSDFKKTECGDLCNARLIAGISYSF